MLVAKIFLIYGVVCVLLSMFSYGWLIVPLGCVTMIIITGIMFYQLNKAEKVKKE